MFTRSLHALEIRITAVEDTASHCTSLGRSGDNEQSVLMGYWRGSRSITTDINQISEKQRIRGLFGLLFLDREGHHEELMREVTGTLWLQ